MEEIREEATRLYFQDPQPTTTTPTDDELKEAGYWRLARDKLMREPGKEAYPGMGEDYLEELAHDVGLRLVSEADHDKLIDLEVRGSRIRNREKRVQQMTRDLEILRADLHREGKLKTVTVEKVVQEIRWRTRKRRKKRVRDKAIKWAQKNGLGLLGGIEAMRSMEALEEIGSLDVMQIEDLGSL
jgi:hypothetical protein